MREKEKEIERERERERKERDKVELREIEREKYLSEFDSIIKYSKLNILQFLDLWSYLWSRLHTGAFVCLKLFIDDK